MSHKKIIIVIVLAAVLVLVVVLTNLGPNRSSQKESLLKLVGSNVSLVGTMLEVKPCPIDSGSDSCPILELPGDAPTIYLRMRGIDNPWPESPYGRVVSVKGKLVDTSDVASDSKTKQLVLSSPDAEANINIVVPDSTCGHDDRQHLYQGEIKPGMPVNIVLSCDRKMMTVSGSVNQVISGSGRGSLVSFKDYNFDGYFDPVTKKFVWNKELSHQ